MFLGNLGASIIGNMSTRKGFTAAGRGYNNMDHLDKNS